MRLTHETMAFSRWFVRIMKVFIGSRPFTTMTVILSESAASMTRILSLLLPIKIILLAGSPGIPKWFPFIDEELKTTWIICLAIAAIGFFVITLFLEAVNSRLSNDAGKEILYKANELCLLKNQEEAVKDYYGKFCGICAALIFLLLASTVLVFLNPILLIFLICMFFLVFIFTGWIVSGCDINPGRLKKYIFNDLNNYLKLATSIIFLSAFIIILIPFLTGDGGNIIVAILSFILIRRSMSFVTGSVKDAVKLSEKQHQIDALIFPDIQIVNPENKENLAVRDLFYKSAREEMSRNELKGILPDSSQVETHWMDSTASGLYMFKIFSNDIQGNSRLYQLQAFPAKSAHFFENEDYLFTKISRKELNAPGLITRFNQDPFICQVVDYGTGKAIPSKEWKNTYDELLACYWSFQPPDTLMKAFSASHLLLHQSLNVEQISKVELAIDTVEEGKLFQQFKANYGRVCEFLKSVPLYIHNPELKPNNVVQGLNSDIFVMTWGKWCLKPVGTVMPNNGKGLEDMIKKIRESRDDVSDDLSVEHIKLVFNCQKLENEIKRGAFKAALNTIKQLMKNKLLV